MVVAVCFGDVVSDGREGESWSWSACIARRMYALLEAGPGGLERSERRPEGVGSLRPVGEILTRLKEVPAGP